MDDETIYVEPIPMPAPPPIDAEYGFAPRRWLTRAEFESIFGDTFPREPVKLSRERWEMLSGAWASKIGCSQLFNAPPINVTTPVETEGVIFLPAEYVPEQVVR